MSSYCPSTETLGNLNPLNWSSATQKKAVTAVAVMGLTAVALYALSSIPGADAFSHNFLRAMQVADEQGAEAGALHYVIGNTFGNRAADTYSNGLSGALLGGAYENCMKACDGIISCLACQILKP